MTKPVSMDIRDRAMVRLNADETEREAADAVSVAPAKLEVGFCQGIMR